VLTHPPVQRDESDVQLRRANTLVQVRTGEDSGHRVSLRLERRGDGLPGLDRNLSLFPPTTHQDADVLCHARSAKQDRRQTKETPQPHASVWTVAVWPQRAAERAQSAQGVARASTLAVPTRGCLCR